MAKKEYFTRVNYDRAKPIQPVSIIISKIYKKLETCISKTQVNNIVRDELLKTKEWKVFVVDNGKSLSKEDLKIECNYLIVWEEAVAYARLVEALQSETIPFLFMDDDRTIRINH